MIPAIVAIAALAALLAYREYVHAYERRLFIAERAEAQELAAKERSDLAQRIQAPQMAVLEHHETEPIPQIPFDDDEAFWAVREELKNRG